MGKKILIGVSGSIAAYKIAVLIRHFIKEGHEVKCIMTEAAKNFISPLTLSTLSKNEVFTDLFSDGSWHNHVALGLWADLMIVAPATANTLSKMASGQADNILIATYLSAKCPVYIAPAMDLDMWHHGSTKKNIERLTSYGNVIIPVGYGELASGLVGDGRMAEPEQIADFIHNHAGATDPKLCNLKGKKILITAGPTYEHLDPVRFIGNHSSGKMGIAIANLAHTAGAEVHLVLGPTSQKPASQYTTHHVVSADDMYQACMSQFGSSDIVIFAAAVADYKPKIQAEQKIKKADSAFSLDLVKNIDIAGTLGPSKKNQIVVGFALETNDEEKNALVKVHKKNFDFIVLNSLRDKGAGFGHDTNEITILEADGTKTEFSLKSKNEVAKDILYKVNLILSNKK